MDIRLAAEFTQLELGFQLNHVLSTGPLKCLKHKSSQGGVTHVAGTWLNELLWPTFGSQKRATSESLLFGSLQGFALEQMVLAQEGQPRHSGCSVCVAPRQTRIQSLRLEVALDLDPKGFPKSFGPFRPVTSVAVPLRTAGWFYLV